MSGIKVGVVRGGPSSEYEISLKTGGEVLKHLPKNYRAVDVLLTKEGFWHLSGFPKKSSQIFDPAHGGVDVIFNALHGEFGEDGRLQQIFDSHSIPYTGSSALASALAMKKNMARKIFVDSGIKIPRALVFEVDDFFGADIEGCVKKAFNSISPPWVTKPVSAGSSVGVSVCKTPLDLTEGVRSAFGYGDKILVEEYIKGREATCGILENFRGEKLYALPPVEIIPPKDKFFDYEVKYDGSTQEICPAGFDIETKRKIEGLAKKAHQILGCRHYSRVDFIVTNKDIYLLEVNTLPGLTSESLFPKAASMAGLEFPQLLDHLVQLALKRK